MPKLSAPLSLTLTLTRSLTLAFALALAFGAAARADMAAGDVYQEAIWDIHATAVHPDTGKTGKSAAGDLYQEAIWDVQAATGDQPLTGSQSASRLMPDDSTRRIDSVE